MIPPLLFSDLSVDLSSDLSVDLSSAVLNFVVDLLFLIFVVLVVELPQVNMFYVVLQHYVAGLEVGQLRVGCLMEISL